MIACNYNEARIIIKDIEMFLKDILKTSKQYLLDTPNFIRLIFTIWFCRYFYIIIILANNINTLFTYRLDRWLDVASLFTTVKNWVITNNIGRVIAVLIIFAIGYLLMYPVWLSAWVHFVADKDKSISRSFAHGLKDFFLMFEFNWLALSFWEFTYITTTSRLFAIDILDNWIMLGLDILWLIFVIFASIFWQYAKYILVLEKWKNGEDLWIFEAIKRSISLSVSNLWFTFKWYITRIIVSLLFYIRMVVILAVPLLILYFLVTSDIIVWHTWIIWLLVTITILLWTYLFVVIQAFFVKFQYEMYKKVTEKTDDTK